MQYMHVLREWWGTSPSLDDLIQFGHIELYLKALADCGAWEVLESPVTMVGGAGRGSERDRRESSSWFQAALPLHCSHCNFILACEWTALNVLTVTPDL